MFARKLISRKARSENASRPLVLVYRERCVRLYVIFIALEIMESELTFYDDNFCKFYVILVPRASVSFGHVVGETEGSVHRIPLPDATSFPGYSLYFEKVPWLRLVTCLSVPTQAALRVGPQLNFVNTTV